MASSIRVVDYYSRSASTTDTSDMELLAAGDPRQDHERYLLLQDFLDEGASDIQQKQAQEDEDTRDIYPSIEKGKQERFVGKRGIQQAFGKVIRDLTTPYLPFDYYGENPAAGRLAENFYQTAYGFVRRVLPMQITHRLNRGNLLGYEAQPGDIKIDPEYINKVITDLMLYANERPEALEDALIRAYSKKGKEEGQVQVHDGRERAVLGVGQAVFAPKLDDASYAQQKKVSEAEGKEFDLKPGDIDSSVVKNVGGRDSVKWEWKGYDDRGILKFTLPELYGSRVFEMRAPQEIQNIRPGTYTFKIKGAGKRKVLLEFVEQRDAIRGDSLKALERTGLSEDQMRHFINTLLTHYVHHIVVKKPEKLMEELTGKLTVRGKDIGDAVELGEVTEEKRTEKLKGLGKGEEWEQKAQEQYDKLLEIEQSKADAVINTWGEEISPYFLRMNDSEGDDLVRAIADKYPERSLKKTPSFQSILETKPVIQIILRNIFKTPEISRKSVREGLPWVFFTVPKIKEAMIKNPAVREQVAELIAHTSSSKKPGVDTPATPISPEQVTDQDIYKFQESITGASFTTIMTRMAKDIKDTMLSLKGHPTIQNFFQRQVAFNNYMAAVKNDFKDDLDLFVERRKINIASPEGKKMVADFTGRWLKEKNVPKESRDFFKEYTQKATKKKAPKTAPVTEPVLQPEKIDQPAVVQPSPETGQLLPKTASMLIHMLMPKVKKYRGENVR